MALHQDPNWPRAATWLGAAPYESHRSVGVLSVPVNASITPGRCELAPGAVRHALQRFSLHEFQSGRSLEEMALIDCGEVEARNPAELVEPLALAQQKGFESHEALVLLGGDNSITYAGVQGLGDLEKVGVITLDAHLDVRDTSKGISNGNPIRALIEKGLPGKNIVQIGLQSFANSTAYAEYLIAQGALGIVSEDVWRNGIEKALHRGLQKLKHCTQIYVDLDLDVLDRAYAPACAGSRPGGLAPWQVRMASRLLGSNPKVRVLDIVEMDPTKDHADITALTAAACLLEFLAGVLVRP